MWAILYSIYFYINLTGVLLFESHHIITKAKMSPVYKYL